MHQDKTKPVTGTVEELAREACGSIDDDDARDICERQFTEAMGFDDDGTLQGEDLYQKISAYFADVEIFQVVAEGCPPCINQKPITDKYSKAGVPLKNIDIDDAEELGFDGLVTGTPTRVYSCDGEVVFVGEGLADEEELKGELEKGRKACRATK